MVEKLKYKQWVSSGVSVFLLLTVANASFAVSRAFIHNWTGINWHIIMQHAPKSGDNFSCPDVIPANDDNTQQTIDPDSWSGDFDATCVYQSSDAIYTLTLDMIQSESGDKSRTDKSTVSIDKASNLVGRKKINVKVEPFTNTGGNDTSQTTTLSEVHSPIETQPKLSVVQQFPLQDGRTASRVVIHSGSMRSSYWTDAVTGKHDTYNALSHTISFEPYKVSSQTTNNSNPVSKGYVLPITRIIKTDPGFVSFLDDDDFLVVGSGKFSVTQTPVDFTDGDRATQARDEPSLISPTLTIPAHPETHAISDLDNDTLTLETYDRSYHISPNGENQIPLKVTITDSNSKHITKNLWLYQRIYFTDENGNLLTNLHTSGGSVSGIGLSYIKGPYVRDGRSSLKRRSHDADTTVQPIYLSVMGATPSSYSIYAHVCSYTSAAKQKLICIRSQLLELDFGQHMQTAMAKMVDDDAGLKFTNNIFTNIVNKKSDTGPVFIDNNGVAQGGMPWVRGIPVYTMSQYTDMAQVTQYNFLTTTDYSRLSDKNREFVVEDIYGNGLISTK